MIDSLNGFLNVIKSSKDMLVSTKIENSVKIEKRDFQPCTDELFCPKCGNIRRCDVIQVTWDSKFYINCYLDKVDFGELPYLFKATCLQCGSETLLLLYNGPEEVELAVLHNTYSGCVTPNSPKEVKYYIDQAYRSRSVGAVSAAMAMYRSALEWLLYEQGFKSGMLGQKISELEAVIKKHTAPKWAIEIDTAFLTAIKDIGNGAMHTNGGDITKQKNIDKDLLELVDVVFAELLDKIYEQPIRSSSNLAKLKAKASAVK
jgi:hypothetical protein